MKAFIECGSCGMYHREDFYGDCRNDDERFNIDQIPKTAKIISIEEQLEEERRIDALSKPRQT